MPLQNRVSPFGELFVTHARGTLLGNRGGKFHTDDRKLTGRRWVSRQWICCVLEFNNRQRDVWGRYYTELFFLDEVTAFAAGHRPCFECRRKDADTFARLFSGKKKRATAPAMDEILHAERLDGKAKRLHRHEIDMLPDGAMITRDGASLCRARQKIAAMDTCGLWAAGTSPAQHNRGRAHTAVDSGCACCRLPADVASEREA